MILASKPGGFVQNMIYRHRGGHCDSLRAAGDDLLRKQEGQHTAGWLPDPDALPDIAHHCGGVRERGGLRLIAPKARYD